MKAKLRRGAIIFLSVLLTAAMLCGMTVSAADTADRGVRLYRGTFYYTGNKDTFYYGDSYFDFASDADNEHLRTFSAALAFSVLGTSGEDTIELMTNIGMEPDSIVMEDMVSGTPDTIGTVIAKKQLKDQPLVAVAIRGSDYAGEWANNVTVGTEGDASGFAAAAAKVAQRIQTYLNDNDIAKAKIWVVGYSRAGGVANLIGKAMNEDPGAFRTNAEDIYVYTYEAPRCSENDTVYKNIHNIFDVNDLVPHFYPESWGLHLNINVFEKLKQMDSYYTAGVRIKPGDVIIGQNRYTFDENGWPLEDIVRASGFTERDMEIWRNGYELRINNELTEIAEPDIELYLKAAGKFDKSMSMYKFYELSMTKTVGFRTYPVDKSIKLKDNPVCLTVPQEIAKKCVRYGVARVDDDGSYKLDTEIVKLDNGDTQLWVNGIYPAVYASAIDDRRWCTRADVDLDDEVTVVDATHIQRHLADMEEFDDLQKITSDVDGDGETTIVDSSWIQRFLASQMVPYAIGEMMEITEE